MTDMTAGSGLASRSASRSGLSTAPSTPFTTSFGGSGAEFLCARCNSMLASAAELQHGRLGGSTVVRMEQVAAAKALLGMLAGGGSTGTGHDDATSGDHGATAALALDDGAAGWRSRLPCLFFRILLPDLPVLPPDVVARLKEQTAATAAAFAPGRSGSHASRAAGAITDGHELIDDVLRPSRPVPWVRWCMRAILLAKQREDSLLAAGRPDAYQASAARRVPFPAFVYAWFEDTPFVHDAETTALSSPASECCTAHPLLAELQW